MNNLCFQNLIDDDEDDLELNNPNATDPNFNSSRSTSSVQRTFAGEANGQADSSHRSVTVVHMSQHQGENIRPGKMVQTREFWILWFTFFLNTQSIGYINAMYKVKNHIIFVPHPMQVNFILLKKSDRLFVRLIIFPLLFYYRFYC